MSKNQQNHIFINSPYWNNKYNIEKIEVLDKQLILYNNKGEIIFKEFLKKSNHLLQIELNLNFKRRILN